MRYLGNYKSWVRDDLLQAVLEQSGQPRPGVEENKSSAQQGTPWKDIPLTGAKWSFHYNEIGIDDIQLPVAYNGTLNWWFVKLAPTCTFPLHQDTFRDDSEQVRRLWIPYQDYIPGHIFIYKDQLIKDYTAGDIFEFDDALAIHGSANLSTVPKISLQVVIYNA